MKNANIALLFMGLTILFTPFVTKADEQCSGENRVVLENDILIKGLKYQCLQRGEEPAFIIKQIPEGLSSYFAAALTMEYNFAEEGSVIIGGDTLEIKGSLGDWAEAWALQYNGAQDEMKADRIAFRAAKLSPYELLHGTSRRAEWLAYKYSLYTVAAYEDRLAKAR